MELEIPDVTPYTEQWIKSILLVDKTKSILQELNNRNDVIYSWHNTLHSNEPYPSIQYNIIMKN